MYTDCTAYIPAHRELCYPCSQSTASLLSQQFRWSFPRPMFAPLRVPYFSSAYKTTPCPHLVGDSWCTRVRAAPYRQLQETTKDLKIILMRMTMLSYMHLPWSRQAKLLAGSSYHLPAEMVLWMTSKPDR